MRASCSRSLRLIAQFVGELAKRIDRVDEAALIGVVEHEPRARVPELRVALRCAHHEIAFELVLHVRRIRGIVMRVRRSGFEHVGRGVFCNDERRDEHARDVGNAFDVREVVAPRYAVIASGACSPRRKC